MASSWTTFLPQAQKWVSGLGLHPLYGHPHKAKKPRKIRIARAHLTNHLLSHGKHPPAIVSKRNPFRRTRAGSYNQR